MACKVFDMAARPMQVKSIDFPSRITFVVINGASDLGFDCVVDRKTPLLAAFSASIGVTILEEQNNRLRIRESIGLEIFFFPP
jgi:hypothetical protein